MGLKRRRRGRSDAQTLRTRTGKRALPAERRIGPIIQGLKQQYPDAKTALNYTNPLELLVATILSAQCTDKRVNIVTAELFQRYRTAADYANANSEEFEQEIKSTGFYRNKTKAILSMAQGLVERHDGQVPDTMEELVVLPGVGRKTANVVLGSAFGKNEGVVVDTHVKRVATRLGLTKQSNPDKIERDLMQLVPQAAWSLFSHLLIFHGRQICVARTPKCEICPVNRWCPAARV